MVARRTGVLPNALWSAADRVYRRLRFVRDKAAYAIHGARIERPVTFPARAQGPAKAQDRWSNQQQARHVRRLERSREPGVETMSAAASAERLEFGWSSIVQEPLAALLGCVEQDALEADSAQVRQAIEIRRSVGPQHANKANLRRKRPQSPIKPVERGTVDRELDRIDASGDERAHALGESFRLVWRRAERRADAPPPGRDRLEASFDRFPRGGRQQPLARVLEVNDVGAAVQGDRRLLAVDDARQHQGHRAGLPDGRRLRASGLDLLLVRPPAQRFPP